MNKVSRYNMRQIFDGRMVMLEVRDGAFVRHDDYYTLLAERDTLNQQVVNLAVENAALQSTIKELESTVSQWEDCKHDGATWYDYSGREKCGCCGVDI